MEDNYILLNEPDPDTDPDTNSGGHSDRTTIVKNDFGFLFLDLMMQFGRTYDFNFEKRKNIMIAAWQNHHKTTKSYDE